MWRSPFYHDLGNLEHMFMLYPALSLQDVAHLSRPISGGPSSLDPSVAVQGFVLLPSQPGVCDAGAGRGRTGGRAGGPFLNLEFVTYLRIVVGLALGW